MVHVFGPPFTPYPLFQWYLQSKDIFIKSQYEMLQLTTKRWNSVFNAQCSRLIIVVIVLVWKPILQAKWSNKQKTKVLCIKVHFVHFYPSIIFKNQMCPNTE
jgi:hypothetical protein